MKALEEIIKFREEVRGKCVSTTHYISLQEYNEIALLLPNFFNEFRFIKRVTPSTGIDKDKIIEVTIPMRQ